MMLARMSQKNHPRKQPPPVDGSEYIADVGAGLLQRDCFRFALEKAGYRVAQRIVRARGDAWRGETVALQTIHAITGMQTLSSTL